MKTKKKVLLTILCAVLLVAASIAGTMAYFTAKSAVHNTFTVGSVGAGGITETPVDEYGVPTGDDRSEDGNTYKLVSGHTYTKDPQFVVSEGSEACFLFIKVENAIEAIEDPEDTIAAQIADNGWKPLDDELGGSENPGVYYQELAATEEDVTVEIFDHFTVSAEWDGSGDYDGTALDVTSYAIQQDGLTLAEAWGVAQGLD